MRYMCSRCGYIYDETVGMPRAGILPGTQWTWLSSRWLCPGCRAPKGEFQPLSQRSFSPNEVEVLPAVAQEMSATEQVLPTAREVAIGDVDPHEDMREMSYGELSALCSNLSKSCEKQYLDEEASEFSVLADYFEARAEIPADASVDDLLALMREDQAEGFVQANAAAAAAADRGAKRILKWSENATKVANSLLNRYRQYGEQFLANAGVYVCDVCGYIYVGDNLPTNCPVCGVPNFRISKVG